MRHIIFFDDATVPLPLCLVTGNRGDLSILGIKIVPAAFRCEWSGTLAPLHLFCQHKTFRNKPLRHKVGSARQHALTCFGSTNDMYLKLVFERRFGR